MTRIAYPVAAALAAVALLAAGCGGGSGGGTTASGTAGGGSTTSAGANFKVGLVTDIGGLNDRSFNHLAYLGLQKAGKDLGVKTRVLESHANSDYVPNMSSLAQQGYDLVIGVGFLMHDSIRQVAKKFPDTKFMIIDDAWATGDPANLEGTVFHEEQAGYMVGYLAGLLETGAKTVSSVGGQKIPPVDHYIAGYQAGAKAANPQIKTVNAYSNDFVAQDKCKNLALQQITQGSQVVFQVAGGCGLGALDAAKQKGVWGIGVDADQAYLGSYILTSAVKRVDTDVFTTIQQLVNGSLKTGRTFEFTVANGGIDIGKISSKVPQADVQKVQDVKQQIADGQIDIPNTVP
ncbi:MAG TPA: BMP family ABC transporter substrate-binding protein [Gaiellaceae bacterium]|nr:BMP family ABC transporter substrate-binding protein [Gaiellaceae bacterium]